MRRPSRCISLTASAIGTWYHHGASTDFTPNANDSLLTRLEIARDIPIVRLPVGRGHEHTDVVSNHCVGGIPKEALGRRVERYDDARSSMVMMPSTAVRSMACWRASLSRRAASATWSSSSMLRKALSASSNTPWACAGGGSSRLRGLHLPL